MFNVNMSARTLSLCFLFCTSVSLEGAKIELDSTNH